MYSSTTTGSTRYINGGGGGMSSSGSSSSLSSPSVHGRNSSGDYSVLNGSSGAPGGRGRYHQSGGSGSNSSLMIARPTSPTPSPRYYVAGRGSSAGSTHSGGGMIGLSNSGINSSGARPGDMDTIRDEYRQLRSQLSRLQDSLQHSISSSANSGSTPNSSSLSRSRSGSPTKFAGVGSSGFAGYTKVPSEHSLSLPSASTPTGYPVSHFQPVAYPSQAGPVDAHPTLHLSSSMVMNGPAGPKDPYSQKSETLKLQLKQLEYDSLPPPPREPPRPAHELDRQIEDTTLNPMLRYETEVEFLKVENEQLKIRLRELSLFIPAPDDESTGTLPPEAAAYLQGALHDPRANMYIRNLLADRDSLALQLDAAQAEIRSLKERSAIYMSSNTQLYQQEQQALADSQKNSSVHGMNESSSSSSATSTTSASRPVHSTARQVSSAQEPQQPDPFSQLMAEREEERRKQRELERARLREILNGTATTTSSATSADGNTSESSEMRPPSRPAPKVQTTSGQAQEASSPVEPSSSRPSTDSGDSSQSASKSGPSPSPSESRSSDSTAEHSSAPVNDGANAGSSSGKTASGASVQEESTSPTYAQSESASSSSSAPQPSGTSGDPHHTNSEHPVTDSPASTGESLQAPRDASESSQPSTESTQAPDAAVEAPQVSQASVDAPESSEASAERAQASQAANHDAPSASAVSPRPADEVPSVGTAPSSAAESASNSNSDASVPDPHQPSNLDTQSAQQQGSRSTDSSNPESAPVVVQSTGSDESAAKVEEQSALSAKVEEPQDQPLVSEVGSPSPATSTAPGPQFDEVVAAPATTPRLDDQALEDLRRQRDLERIARMKTGCTVTKLNFGDGKVTRRFLFLSADNSTVCWGKKPGTSSYSSIRLGEITNILVGPQTRAFLSKSAQQQHFKSWMCFSIVVSDRSLDLVVEDQKHIMDWVIGLQALLIPDRSQRTSTGQFLWHRTRLRFQESAREANMAPMELLTRRLIVMAAEEKRRKQMEEVEEIQVTEEVVSSGDEADSDGEGPGAQPLQRHQSMLNPHK